MSSQPQPVRHYHDSSGSRTCDRCPHCSHRHHTSQIPHSDQDYRSEGQMEDGVEPFPGQPYFNTPDYPWSGAEQGQAGIKGIPFDMFTQDTRKLSKNKSVKDRLSNVMSREDRRIVASVKTLCHRREAGTLTCSAEVNFGAYYTSRFDETLRLSCSPDGGTAEDNLDNLEISAVNALLEQVRTKVVPHHRQTIRSKLHTGTTDKRRSEAQVARFNLVVLTSLDPALLHFLLGARALKFSKKKQAYVGTTLGFVTKKYPVTPLRHELISQFIHGVALLACAHVSIYWRPVQPTRASADAKNAFLHEPMTLCDAFQTTL